MIPVLIVHGGAGRGFKTRARWLHVRRKISRVLDRAYQKLYDASALEAVTYAVRLLEDDPEFNAGTGSVLQADGRARLSASLMDGSRMRFAGVINVEGVKNPILLTRILLAQEDRVLAGRGAFQFARKMRLELGETRTRRAIRRWEKALEEAKSYDTVGACALDRSGHLASATSTGGRGCEYPGRVSDSAMPIANYATEKCAVSVTGIGEDIIDEGLAVRIATRVADGFSLRRAFMKTDSDLRTRGRKAGMVGLDARGHIAYLHTTETLIYGWQKGKTVRLFPR